jgi:hypothetical protein
MSFFLGFGDELVKMSAAKLILKKDYKPAKSLKRGYTPSALEHHDKIREKLSTITKSAGPADVAKQLVAIAKKDPAALKAIAKEMASGPGGQTATGLTYGAIGYGSLKGLTRKDPKTKRREPLEGAVRGAAKGALVGLPLALLWRYPALRRAVAARA